MLHSSEAKISAMDRLGMTVNAKLELGGGGMSKVRLTFPRPVAERKAIKEVLVGYHIIRIALVSALMFDSV